MKHVKVVTEQGIPVVLPSGHFTGGKETDEFEQVLEELDRAGSKGVVLDLGDAVYLGTPALSALVATHLRFSKRGARAVLCRVDHRIRQVFQITRLCLVFESFETRAEAIETLRREVASGVPGDPTGAGRPTLS